MSQVCGFDCGGVGLASRVILFQTNFQREMEVLICQVEIEKKINEIIKSIRAEKEIPKLVPKHLPPDSGLFQTQTGMWSSCKTGVGLTV